MLPHSGSPAAPSGHLVIPSLDGLRALSFLLVFVGHAGAWWLPGGFGVTVFFFLSGFLITTLMRVEHERTGSLNLKHFYVRRMLRIWPPFYIVLLTGIALAVLGVFEASLHTPSVLAQVLHVSNYWVIFRDWRGVVPGSGVYWSLAVEEHFYLLFPSLYLLLARLGLRPSQKVAVFASICAAVLAWRCALVFAFHVDVPRTFVATDTRIDSMLYGCALALWHNPALDEPPAAQPRGRDYLELALGALLLGVTFAVRSPWFRETFRYTLQGLGLIPIFRSAIRFPRWGAFKVLNWKGLGALGALSYTMYLVHHTVLEVIQGPLAFLAWPLRAAIAFAISYAFARAMWVLVEEPCAELRRRLTQTRRAPVPPLRANG